MGKLISLENIDQAQRDDAAYRALKLEVTTQELISKLNHEILFRPSYKSWQVSVNSLDEIACEALKRLASSDILGADYHVAIQYEGRETSLVISAVDYRLAS